MNTPISDVRRRAAAQLALDLERMYPGPDGGLLPYTLAKKACTYGNGYCVNPDHGDDPRRAGRGSWLCPNCVDGMRRSLTTIAESWPFLEELLRPGVKAKQEGGPATATGSPAPLDVNVADVMEQARKVIWDLRTHLIEDRPALRIPVDVTAAYLAEWFRDRHMDYIAKHPADSFAASVPADLRAAARQCARTVTPPDSRVRILHGQACRAYVGEAKAIRRCGGELAVRLFDHARHGESEIFCRDDPGHRWPEDQWLLLGAMDGNA